MKTNWNEKYVHSAHQSRYKQWRTEFARRVRKVYQKSNSVNTITTRIDDIDEKKTETKAASLYLAINNKWQSIQKYVFRSRVLKCSNAIQAEKFPR